MPYRVLVACEFSGIVRDAFAALGHDAWSCDLYRSERPGKHIIGDVRLVLADNWDLMIAHPPCTHLAISGARWFAPKQVEQELALSFVSTLLAAPIPRICLENPRSIISTRVRPPDQVVHPWWFGHPEKKETWLWLKNLPLLQPTKIVTPSKASVHWAPDSAGRSEDRSRTFKGFAAAMAAQWGSTPGPATLF
jgi:site-specific DNA-cytosine methylase